MEVEARHERRSLGSEKRPPVLRHAVGRSKYNRRAPGGRVIWEKPLPEEQRHMGASTVSSWARWSATSSVARRECGSSTGATATRPPSTDQSGGERSLPGLAGGGGRRHTLGRI